MPNDREVAQDGVLRLDEVIDCYDNQQQQSNPEKGHANRPVTFARENVGVRLDATVGLLMYRLFTNRQLVNILAVQLEAKARFIPYRDRTL